MDPGMVKNLALGAVPPALLVAAFFAAAWARRGEPRQPEARTDWRIVATPLVFALAVVATYWIAFGAPTLKPVASIDWLPLIAVGAGIAGAFAAAEGLPAVVRFGPTALALALAAWGSVKNLLASASKVNLVTAELLEFALASGVALAGTLYVARRGRIAPILLLLLFAGGACQLLVLAYANMKVGQVVGMSASMLGAALLVALWRKNFNIGAGAVVFVVVLTMAGVLQSRLYGRAAPEIGRAYGALLILAVGAAWIVEAAAPQRWPARLRASLVVIATALPLAIGLGLAGKKWMADQQADEAEPYDQYELE